MGLVDYVSIGVCVCGPVLYLILFGLWAFYTWGRSQVTEENKLLLVIILAISALTAPLRLIFEWLTMESDLEKRQAALVEQWRRESGEVYLMPVAVRLDAVLPAADNQKYGMGLLGILGDRLEFHYGLNYQRVLRLRSFQLRAYGLLDEDGRLKRDDALTVMICTQPVTNDWHVYRFTVLTLETWTALAAALHTISGLSPVGMSEPVNAVAYRQDMLGHWQRTDYTTTLFLIPQRLLLDWQAIINFDQLREVAVLPSPGVSPLPMLMLVIKYMAADGTLQTVGFDLLFGEATAWAQELHERSGTPLHMATDRKKKA